MWLPDMTGSSDPHPFDPLPPKHSGVLHALQAFKYSYAGIVATFRSESAFRQEVVCAAVLIPVAVFLRVQPVERVALIGPVLLVLLVELLNSAIEAVVDRISPEHHELSRRAKDCGSAAVMLSLIMCAFAWGFICGPPFVRWLQRAL
jgi:diacylglycerol kinase (ATP)